MSEKATESEKSFRVFQTSADGFAPKQDVLAVEEPMEIRVVFGPTEKRTGKSLSITMRTPSHDFELAAGFLFTESIISHEDQIAGFEFCGPIAEGRSEANIVRVELTPGVEVDIKKLQRHFYTTSSCGVCGKASLEALEVQGLKPLKQDGISVSSEVIRSLPDHLRSRQDVFDRTGGLHAAGLFDLEGNLISIREDVGRHNALDKLIGKQFLNGKMPLSDRILVVSGRASFELLQKALVTSAPIMVAVGAPSSLAVELAQEFNLTLLGFASKTRFNVYSGIQRVV